MPASTLPSLYVPLLPRTGCAWKRLPLLGFAPGQEATGLEVTVLCLTDPDLSKGTWILAGSKQMERRRDGSWTSLLGGRVLPMLFLSHGGDDTRGVTLVQADSEL